MTALRTLPEALARAARGPEGFVFAVSDTESYRSYAEIHDVSSRVAAGLRAIGLGSTDVAALILADPEQFLTALFGAAIPASYRRLCIRPRRCLGWRATWPRRRERCDPPVRGRW